MSLSLYSFRNVFLSFILTHTANFPCSAGEEVAGAPAGGVPAGPPSAALLPAEVQELRVAGARSSSTSPMSSRRQSPAPGAADATTPAKTPARWGRRSAGLLVHPDPEG